MADNCTNCPDFIIAPLVARVNTAVQEVNEILSLVDGVNAIEEEVTDEIINQLKLLVDAIPLPPVIDLSLIVDALKCPLTPLALAMSPADLSSFAAVGRRIVQQFADYGRYLDQQFQSLLKFNMLDSLKGTLDVRPKDSYGYVTSANAPVTYYPPLPAPAVEGDVWKISGNGYVGGIPGMGYMVGGGGIGGAIPVIDGDYIVYDGVSWARTTRPPVSGIAYKTVRSIQSFYSRLLSIRFSPEDYAYAVLICGYVKTTCPETYTAGPYQTFDDLISLNNLSSLATSIVPTALLKQKVAQVCTLLWEAQAKIAAWKTRI